MEVAELCAPAGGYFGWIDYIVLTVVLLVSCLIGVALAMGGKSTSEQTTSDDFFLGGSSMGTVTTALSLAAGFVTAIELLGNPSEVYSHGTQFWMICISFLLVVPITSYLYLPVFVKLQLTSAYEFLEMRFSRSTRVFAASMYILQMIFYTSVAVYAPALALSNVTGLNTYLAVTVVYMICIFYSSQGGMKAVILTDTFQAIVLVISIIVVAGIGNYYLGGMEKIIESNLKSDRIEFFIMNPSPTIRHSFWSVVIGGTFYWATMFCSNQSSIQKYLSVENLEKARKALWISSFGLVLVFSINFYTGMILYDQYQTCDPLQNKEINAMDELLPLYVMKIQGHLKGIPGLFVSGIFAASLGTVASAVNSLSAVTMKDIIGGLFEINIAADRSAYFSKWLSVFFGVLSFALVFVVEQLGSVLQVALTFNGITGGITLGLFSLGMFFPWANSKGALSGGAFGLLLVSWMGIGAQYAMAVTNFDPAIPKPISVDGCLCSNSTIENDVIASPMWLYRVSYLWYSAIGCIATFMVGAAVSLMTNPEKPSNIHEDLISPPIKGLLESLPQSWQMKLNIIESGEVMEDYYLKNLGSHSSLAGTSLFKQQQHIHYNTFYLPKERPHHIHIISTSYLKEKDANKAMEGVINPALSLEPDDKGKK